LPWVARARDAVLRLACLRRSLLLLDAPLPHALADTSREAVLSVLGRQGLRCLRSSCRGGRAAANERVTSAEMRLAPLPPNLPNLRHVDFDSRYANDARAAAAVAALPDSVVGMQMEALYGSDALLAAIGARRGLQSLGFASYRNACVGVLDAVVRGPSLTSLTSLKINPQGSWAPPPSLLQRVPWQQLQVSRRHRPQAPGATAPGARLRATAPVQARAQARSLSTTVA
jgi:hypothetical protein